MRALSSIPNDFFCPVSPPFSNANFRTYLAGPAAAPANLTGVPGCAAVRPALSPGQSALGSSLKLLPLAT